MAEIWADIDLRSTEASSQSASFPIARVPVFVRTIRQVASLGYSGARLIATSKEAAGVVETLANFQFPAGFVVETCLGPPDSVSGRISGPGKSARKDIRLDGRGLYTLDALKQASLVDQPPVPGIVVYGPDDRLAAEKWLLRETRKPMRLDGFVAFFVLRPLSNFITRPLLRTPISANAVTLLAMAAGLTAATFAGFSHHKFSLLAAGGLYFATGILDCVDGDLARLRQKGSRFGQWLDSMTDETTTMTLLLALGWRFYTVGAQQSATACFAAAAVGFFTLLYLYRVLVTRKLPIDTAVFPWFFWDSYPSAPKTKTPLRAVVDTMGYLTRRDINVTVIAILLAANLPGAAAGLLGMGYILFGLLTICHIIVMSRTNSAS